MRLRLLTLGMALVLGAGPGVAQTPPSTTNAPAPTASETQPAPQPQTPAAPATPPADTPSPAPGPSATGTQPAPTPAPTGPAAPAPAQPSANTTLFPNPSDPTGVEEGVLVAKPAVVLSGTSTWDEAFNSLKNAATKLGDELKKAGIAPAGRPIAIFVDTDDNGFKYEAMIPIAQAPEGKTELTPEIKFGKTPEGKALRFVHKDAYDEIDGTYETITAYLDLKEIVAKDAFIEEYVGDFTDAQDADFEVNIYVQPK